MIINLNRYVLRSICHLCCYVFLFHSFSVFCLHFKIPRENAQSIQNHVKLKAKNATLTGLAVSWQESFITPAECVFLLTVVVTHKFNNFLSRAVVRITLWSRDSAKDGESKQTRAQITWRKLQILTRFYSFFLFFSTLSLLPPVHYCNFHFLTRIFTKDF